MSIDRPSSQIIPLRQPIAPISRPTLSPHPAESPPQSERAIAPLKENHPLLGIVRSAVGGVGRSTLSRIPLDLDLRSWVDRLYRLEENRLYRLK